MLIACFEEQQAILSALQRDLPLILHLAFDEEAPVALLPVHKTLEQIYEVSLSHPVSPICLHEPSPWLSTIRHELETAWLNYELVRLKQQLPDDLEARQPELLCAWFVPAPQTESDIDKWVLNFLTNQVSIHQFNLFLLSDATLNYRFFDALALAQLYFLETVK